MITIAASGAALAWQGKGNSSCSRYVGSIRCASRSETKRSHHLIELLGVVSILDLRLHQIAIDSAVRADPKRHTERNTTQLLRRSIERERHVTWLRRTQGPSLATTPRPRAATRARTTTHARCVAGAGALSVPRTARIVRARRRVAGNRDRSCVSGLRDHPFHRRRLSRRRGHRLLRRNWNGHCKLRWRFDPRDRRQRNIRHTATPATAGSCAGRERWIPR